MDHRGAEFNFPETSFEWVLPIGIGVAPMVNSEAEELQVAGSA